MKLKRIIRDNRGLFLFVVLMICFRSAIADWNYVPSSSMEPTILPGDEVFVNKMAYDIRLPLTSIALWHIADPVPGDIVTFKSVAADKRLVKRVIGVPGDEISLFNNRLFVNGQAAQYLIRESHHNAIDLVELFNDVTHAVKIEQDTSSRLSSFDAVKIPPGYLLVLGDNRNNSADSRVYGLVPRNELTGKVVRVIASLDVEDYYKPRTDRFFQRLQ